ncbi:uncharacterized protein ARMOST_02594 [Armillaria ostoyae]|uniref:Uncharacterized protein n=1 Tax=Armillaria ostoyae TaxID=47428 RepID=A0A284QSD7_ARMOS|nr:uncharacterized protein ARMOST_02594 [Armillaria ostoyae]
MRKKVAILSFYVDADGEMFQLVACPTPILSVEVSREMLASLSPSPVLLKMLTGKRKGAEGHGERTYNKDGSATSKHETPPDPCQVERLLLYKWNNNDASSPARQKLETLSFLSLNHTRPAPSKI